MSDRAMKVLYGIFAVAICTIVVGPLAYCAHVDRRLKYWDQRVTELCRGDGGATVYETVPIGVTARDRAYFWRYRISTEGDKPYKLVKHETIINAVNPGVSRVQWDYLRTSTNKLLGTTVDYYRYGGDPFITIDNPSRFSCADLRDFVGQSAEGRIFTAGPYVKELE